GEFLARSGFKVPLARVEKNVGHVDDQSASGVAGCENDVELIDKFLAKLGLFTFGLGGSKLCPIGFSLNAVAFASRTLSCQIGFDSGAVGGEIGCGPCPLGGEFGFSLCS